MDGNGTMTYLQMSNGTQFFRERRWKKMKFSVDGCDILHQLIDGLSHDFVGFQVSTPSGTGGADRISQASTGQGFRAFPWPCLVTFSGVLPWLVSGSAARSQKDCRQSKHPRCKSIFVQPSYVSWFINKNHQEQTDRKLQQTRLFLELKTNLANYETPPDDTLSISSINRCIMWLVRPYKHP